MKNFKILIVLFLGMILLLFTGCSSPTKEIVFQLEENDVELHIGDTYEPKILIENISDYDLEYSYDTQGLKIEDGIIKDIRFDGEACAICTSSTSVMIETLIGKNISEVEKIYQNFYNMIEEKDFDEEILEAAIAYCDIAKQPNRKKCALLPWWGIEKIIKMKGKDNG
jgi:hypothetical protein